jgi:hypothetical protein
MTSHIDFASLVASSPSAVVVQDSNTAATFITATLEAGYCFSEDRKCIYDDAKRVPAEALAIVAFMGEFHPERNPGGYNPKFLHGLQLDAARRLARELLDKQTRTSDYNSALDGTPWVPGMPDVTGKLRANCQRRLWLLSKLHANELAVLQALGKKTDSPAVQSLSSRIRKGLAALQDSALLSRLPLDFDALSPAEQETLESLEKAHQL